MDANPLPALSRIDAHLCETDTELPWPCTCGRTDTEGCERCNLPPGYSDGEYADPTKPVSEQDDEMVEF